MPADVPTAIGRYQIVRTLGEGGMGSVNLARDPAIDRHVAIKLMRSGFDDAGMRERFAREAKSIGKLHHANIVTVFDVGEHQGEPFIAMEFVEGQTLSHFVRHPEIGTVLDRIGWIDGICAGLSYAHRAGIIHRDIKPANIMIDADGGGVKILDFGIARGTTAGMTHTATQAGTILGTLNYMSPEQLSGRTVDQRTDIFSAGAVFYELLAGRMAFPGDIQSGVLHYILSTGPVEPLAQACPTLDPGLVAFVSRCLERDVDLRYADLGGARRDLVAIRRRIEGGDVSSGATVVIAPAAGSPSDSRPGRTPGPDTRAELQRLRKERISEQLTQARAALSREDFTGALDGCRQALIIDPEHSAALELQEQIETAQQAHDWLTQAQSALDKGALTSAAMLADRVLGVVPTSPAALSIRKGIEEARRRLEDVERRARAVDVALTEARAHLASGRLDQATAAVAKALEVDRDNAEALALRSKVAAAVDARRRADEEARAQQIIARAQGVVTAARERFAEGDHDAALALLRAHQPKHVLVEEAIAALEREKADLERRAEAERQAEVARREEGARRQHEADRREAEARHKAEEEERRRLKAEEKAAKAAAAQAAREQEEHEAQERRRVADARRAAEHAAQVEAEARRKAEDDARRAEAEANKRAETEARRRADEEARRARAAASAVASAPSDATVIIPPFAEPHVALVRAPAGRNRVFVIGGAAAVVLIGFVGWIMSRPSATAPPPTPVAGPASVVIDIRPWASIERIDRKSDGQAMNIACKATPCLVSLAPGEYHARATNPYFQTLDFDFTVTADGTPDVRKSLPGFTTEDEVRRILGGG